MIGDEKCRSDGLLAAVIARIAVAGWAMSSIKVFLIDDKAAGFRTTKLSKDCDLMKDMFSELVILKRNTL